MTVNGQALSLPRPIVGVDVGHALGLSLDERVASGTVSDVFAARTADGTRVIARVLHARLVASTDVREQFLKDAEAVASLRARSVVRLLDRGLHDGAPVVVEEVIDGVSVLARRESGGMIRARHVLAMADQVLEALIECQDAGTFHGALTGGRIFWTPSGTMKAFGLGFGRTRAAAARAGLLAPPVPSGQDDLAALEADPEKAKPAVDVDQTGTAKGSVHGVAGGTGNTVGGTGTAVKPDPVAPPGPVSLPEDADPPEAIDKTNPPFPEELRAALIAEGKTELVVIVKYAINERGDVTIVKIMRGHPAVDAVVEAQVRSWKYKPAMYNGTPLYVWRIAKIPFRIKT